MMTGSDCDACGGTGWIQIRTRGMCGIECDFDEVERTPCDICDSQKHYRVAAGPNVEADPAVR